MEMTVMEGSLSKWTNVMKGWQYRWFVLDDNSGLLSYYTSKEKMMRGVRRGCVRLKGAVIGIDDEDDSTFTITVDHKTFHFQARDAEDREKWVRALEETISRHGNRMRYDTAQTPPTIKDFDNRVSEADTYLQLMIEQTKNLEDRIHTITEDEEKSKCQLILEHANAMLHNIKHSIVLLQIAKNTAHPINGIYQPLAEPSPSASPITPDAPIVTLEDTVQQGIELGSECIETRGRTRTIVPPPTLAVPTTSYSSSEGEEDFFDANDTVYASSSQVSSPSTLRSFDHENQTTTLRSQSATNSRTSYQKQDSIISRNSLPLGENLNLDYDALYEDEEEPDVEMEGSVIKHLLSQVRIGMDLTKVVLPTFILERRSLLEMYADYFAHPDLFVSIADQETPKDRLIQVVKWYLSSYHAGRKSSVAKKPYNPVLGEIFRCHWDVPNVPAKETGSSPVFDGPIPWCQSHQLAFIAEQVSHHPPISAFYAEHYDKRITFDAFVYTKSKFLGLSVCVYNIGKGVVNVLNHNEEYVVTFPNGYGRSILTVPWIELGGPVVINCPQTGYYCNIEFLTKPFYGNKKNKVTAELFNAQDKKPFLSISGEWNGIMEARVNDTETEMFIDVNAIPVIRKQVKPIKEQAENESRRLWKEVTAGLKFNDIEKATNAKQTVEQRQRDEAKERKELNVDWDTKLFSKGPEDSWFYNTPLEKRLSTPSTSNT